MNFVKKIVLILLSLGLVISIGAVLLNIPAYIQIHNEVKKAEKPLEAENLQREYQQRCIALTLSLLAFCMFFLLIMGILFIKEAIHWWLISICITLMGCLELSMIWYFAYNRGYYYEKAVFAPVENTQQAQAFITKAETQNNGRPFIAIPTGIYIKNIFFTRKDNDVYPGLIVNGIIWQRYKKGVTQDLSRSIILPQANQFSLRRLFHHEYETEEVIGWHFSGLLFQHFDLSKFPFDHRHITLEFLHSDFEKNVVITPDFQAYPLLNSTNNPGLSPQLTLPHWILHKSFFTYRLQHLSTNFGNPQFNTTFPQQLLYIMVQRKLWDSVSIYFILLLTSAVILFIALLAFLKHDTLTGLLGFSTLGILGVCSSLLFVLITSHIEMRENLAIDGTAYFEYLYLILYIAIIIVALNSILFTLHERIHVVQYSNGLILKMAYWPCLVFSALGITLWVFY